MAVKSSWARKSTSGFSNEVPALSSLEGELELEGGMRNFIFRSCLELAREIVYHGISDGDFRTEQITLNIHDSSLSVFAA